MIIEKVNDNTRIVIINRDCNHAYKIIYENEKVNDIFPILYMNDIEVIVTGGKISTEPIIAHMENLCTKGYSVINEDFYKSNYERLI